MAILRSTRSPLSTLSALALTLSSFAFGGCGGSVADAIDSGSGVDSGGSDATDSGPGTDGGGGACPSTTLGKSIYGSCFDGIVVNDISSGFGPPPPQGSECNEQGDVYELDLKSGKRTRTSCITSGQNQPYKKVVQTSTLTPTSIDAVVTALKAVVVASDTGCVSDGPTLTLTVKSSGKDVTYGDDKVSACSGIPVTGIQGVISALQVK
ncbi:hypothetical protein BH09MYX1_BH09MYX1_51260 [soil metagenome]